jgi:arylsulfatase A-like enzyme
MSIRNTFSYIILFTLFVQSGCVRQTDKPIVQQPNILWLTCEDISPAFSFYGDSTAHTPNLDKLASESLIFDNAYAVVGVCAPSRSSIITGMYPTSIGTMHMRTGRDISGWGERKYNSSSSAVDINGTPVGEYAAVVPDYVKCFTEYLRAEGYYCTNNVKTDYQFAAPLTAWNENGNNATWKDTPEGSPFFSVFNHEVTHESRMWINKNLEQTVSPEQVKLPTYFPDDSITRQDVARNYSNIELLDKQIGEKLDSLKMAGLYDNTIIFFFSDHGGPLPRGKREIYDSGLRVPLLVRIPGGKRVGHIDELVSFVDLAPTILSLAGIAPPEYMQGQAFLGKYKSPEPRKYIFGSADRFDEFSDRIRIVRDKQYLFVKNYHPELPAYKDISYRKNIDMMNDMLGLHKAGKLSLAAEFWFRPTKTNEEFYNCETDIYNIDNQIANPEYATKIAELRSELSRWEQEMGDMANIPEAQMIDEMWPEGKQPQTEPPVALLNDKLVSISCNTPGASIGYILSNKKFLPELNSDWHLYDKPVNPLNSKFIYIIATRIGYADSPVIMERLTN